MSTNESSSAAAPSTIHVLQVASRAVEINLITLYLHGIENVEMSFANLAPRRNITSATQLNLSVCATLATRS